MRALTGIAIAFCLALPTWCESLPGNPSAETTAIPLPADEVLIPAGTYVMGRAGADGDRPAHEVTLDAFYLDKYEVTNRQYLEFCRQTAHASPEFWGQDRYCATEAHLDHPVIGVSWYDAKEYAEWASKRLPTEAEWEYAARAGTTGDFYWGDRITTEHCNYAQSDKRAPEAIGSYLPNAFGLYDMAGNVAEWVADAYAEDYYRRSPTHNPTGPEKGRFTVIRGGGWHTGPGCMAVHFRNALPRNWVDFAVGFRCARSVQPASGE
jgi:iron(II)-dependent oxidoreductase